jgi:hypothetical protein
MASFIWYGVACVAAELARCFQIDVLTSHPSELFSESAT